MGFERRIRRTVAERLREALLDLACGHASVLAHDERAWASITFTGARHRLRLRFEGAEAVHAGENFIAFLPEHEFAILRQLVADATVVEGHDRLHPPVMEVVCELLLLEER